MGRFLHLFCSVRNTNQPSFSIWLVFSKQWLSDGNFAHIPNINHLLSILFWTPYLMS